MILTRGRALSVLREYVRGDPEFTDVWINEHHSDPWAISISRGLGPDIEYAKLRISETLAAADISKCIELLVHEARQAVWLWNRPGGLVVGVAGKWRKFGRAA